MNVFKQSVFFLLVSGTGWLLDFGIYFLLVERLLLSLFYANVLSSLAASSFVFTFSVQRIFSARTGRISLRYKYIFYLMYQLILILSVSALAELVYVYWYTAIRLDYPKVWIKVFITPITVICNFIVMKILTERV